MLVRFETISEFLAQFPEAGGVAINWRMHGNNGHVLRPLVPAPVAYSKHSSPEEAINRHVKSFVRPSRVGLHFHNVHCFDVPAPDYLNPEGQRVGWSETPGIINTDPSFENSYIMHFQSRSMEHFIDRAQKRQDTVIDASMWGNTIWSRDFDENPAKFFDGMFVILAKVENNISNWLCLTIRSKLYPPNFSAAAFIERPAKAHATQHLHSETASIYATKIKTFFKTFIHVDPITNLVVHSTTAEIPDQIVYLVRSLNHQNIGILVSSGSKLKPLRLAGDRQAGMVIPIQIVATSTDRMALRSVTTGLYIAAECISNSDGVGRITCSRKVALDWETYSFPEVGLHELSQSSLSIVDAYFSLLSYDSTADALSAWLIQHPNCISTQLIQIALRRLEKAERLRLSAILSQSIPPELLEGSRYS